jgi:prepilin-type N-terminal cleavage/methylation domain-containing protein
MKLKSAQNQNQAFTLVEIMIVVAIIGLLAAIAIPNYVKARENTQLNSIYENLRILEDAKEQWALETRQMNGAPVDSVNVISNYIRGGVIKPVVNELYVPNPVGTPCGASLPTGVSLGKYSAGSFIPLLHD